MSSTVAHYEPVTCRSLLHRIDVSYLPFRWDINPYRGCAHSCVYCFARYSHEYLGLDAGVDFEQHIRVKTNAAEVLRGELTRPRWRREMVHIGGVCDPYQPAEAQYRITRGLLEVLAEHGNPVTLGTKGALIARDADVLGDLAQRTHVSVLFSIATLDTELARKLEPHASPPARRLEAMATLAAAGVVVGVLLMPILPHLTDSDESLNAVICAVRDHGARFVIPGVLGLRRSARERFMPFFRREFPALAPAYDRLYSRSATPPRDVSRPLYARAVDLCHRAGVATDYAFPMPLEEPQQLTLDL
ncbi:MAG: radical SAM protein [Chloroflexi bacterium]|nr:radical SAM protein [Chloroflexota bacterium]MBU1750243.1 radical SAM protein [Chloroflexota bacterium]